MVAGRVVPMLLRIAFLEGVFFGTSPPRRCPLCPTDWLPVGDVHRHRERDLDALVLCRCFAGLVARK